MCSTTELIALGVVGWELIRGEPDFGKGNCVRDVISAERHGALNPKSEVESMLN